MVPQSAGSPPPHTPNYKVMIFVAFDHSSHVSLGTLVSFTINKLLDTIAIRLGASEKVMINMLDKVRINKVPKCQTADLIIFDET